MHFRVRRQQRIRDFHRRQIENPFFGKQRRSRAASFGKIFLMVALAAGLVYGIFYSPLLRTSAVIVEGEMSVPEAHVAAAAKQTVAGYRLLVIPRDHYFFIDADEVKKAVTEGGFPFRSVQVRKGPRSIAITVEERVPTFRVVEEGIAYLLDQDGVVLRAAAAGEGENLIALARKNTSEGIIAGSKIMDVSWPSFILELHKHFATQVGVRDKIYIINKAEGSIEAVTTEDWYVIFDPSVELEQQLGSLATAVANKFGPEERQKLLYIDVRFGERIFYKWK